MPFKVATSPLLEPFPYPDKSHKANLTRKNHVTRHGFWGSKILLSAVELGIFTELARHPLNAETLQHHLELHPRSAKDFFDALVALGMLKRDKGLYGNTTESDLFLDKRTFLHRRVSRNGQCPALPALGISHERASNGPPGKRDQGGWRFFGTL